MEKLNSGMSFIQLIIAVLVVSVLSIMLGTVINTEMTDNDVKEDSIVAAQMTHIVQDYIDAFSPVVLSASEIRWLISESMNTDFLPKQDEAMFWYDLSTNEVVTKPAYEDMPSPRGNTGHQLEEIIEGFLLLSATGSEVNSAINTIRNLRSGTEFYQSSSGAFDILKKHGLEAHALKYSPQNTLYINDFTTYTEVDTVLSLYNILFCDNIEILPRNAFHEISQFLPSEIRLPVSLRYIEQDACSDDQFTTTLIYDDLDQIEVELYAFHPETTKNLQLYNKEGSVTLFELSIAFSEVVTTYRYYSDTEKSHYIGKKVTMNHVLFDIYDSTDHLTGSFIDGRYYNTSGFIVSSGSVYEMLSFLLTSFDLASSHDIEYAQSLSLTIDDDVDDNDFGFISFETIYRTIGHQTLIEVKAYDTQGRYVAKGMKIVDNTWIHGSKPGFSGQQ